MFRSPVLKIPVSEGSDHIRMTQNFVIEQRGTIHKNRPPSDYSGRPDSPQDLAPPRKRACRTF